MANETRATRQVLTIKEKLTTAQVEILNFALGKVADVYAEETNALRAAIEANPGLAGTLSRFVTEFEAKTVDAEFLRGQIAAAQYVQYAYDNK